MGKERNTEKKENERKVKEWRRSAERRKGKGRREPREGEGARQREAARGAGIPGSPGRDRLRWGSGKRGERGWGREGKISEKKGPETEASLSVLP